MKDENDAKWSDLLLLPLYILVGLILLPYFFVKGIYLQMMEFRNKDKGDKEL